MNVKNIPMRQVITSFAGLVPMRTDMSFWIGELEDAKDLSTVRESSLRASTSSPAIGEMVADILKEKNGSQGKRELHRDEKRAF